MLSVTTSQEQGQTKHAGESMRSSAAHWVAVKQVPVGLHSCRRPATEGSRRQAELAAQQPSCSSAEPLLGCPAQGQHEPSSCTGTFPLLCRDCPVIACSKILQDALLLLCSTRRVSVLCRNCQGKAMQLSLSRSPWRIGCSPRQRLSCATVWLLGGPFGSGYAKRYGACCEVNTCTITAVVLQCD